MFKKIKKMIYLVSLGDFSKRAGLNYMAYHELTTNLPTFFYVLYP